MSQDQQPTELDAFQQRMFTESEAVYARLGEPGMDVEAELLAARFRASQD
ncbi:hypothetical protein ACFYVL_43900 [Streptomyces sp. NPDC004111]